MFRSRKNTEPVPDAAPLPVSADPFSSTGVFLGTLRSEVDEPDLLAEPFERLAVVAEGVIGAFRRGTLTEQEAAERLQLLRLKGADDVEWTLGSTSMRWYRRLPKSIWKPAVPPSDADDELTASADRAVEAVAALSPAAVAPVRAAYGAHGPTAAAPEWAPAMPAAPTVDVSDLATAAPGPIPRLVDAVVTPGSEADLDEGPVRDPAVRDWSFNDAEDSTDEAPAGALQVFPTEPVSMRRTLPTLQAVPVADPASGGYGYGLIEEPAPEFTPSFLPPVVDDNPDHALIASPAPAPVEDLIATPSAANGATAGSGEDEELRAMLAALSHDTGIALTGFNQTAD